MAQSKTPTRVTLVLLMLLAVSARAAPQWSLSYTSDSTLIPGVTLDQSSAAVTVFSQNTQASLRNGTRSPNYLAFVFRDVVSANTLLGSIFIGSQRQPAQDLPRIEAGTFVQSTSFANGDGKLPFSRNFRNPNLCEAPLTDFTIGNAEFVDAATATDAALAHLDIAFTTHCTVNREPVTISGHFSYEDPDRRGANLSVVTGIAFEDSNRNGLRDAGEPPVANIGVDVFPADAALTSKPVTLRATDAAGHYELHLPPGSYFLRFVPRFSPAYIEPLNQIMQDDTLYQSLATDAQGQYQVTVPVGYRYSVRYPQDPNSNAGPFGKLTVTQRGVNGANDSDIGYQAPPFRVSTAQPVERDIGLFNARKQVPTLSDYLPLNLGAKWVYEDNFGGRITCMMPGKEVINGVAATRLVCSDGTRLALTVDTKGIRLHRISLHDPRGNGIDGTLSPPLVLARPNLRPDGRWKGSTRATGKQRAGGQSISGTVAVNYNSQLLVGPSYNAYAPALIVGTDAVARAPNGSQLRVSLLLTLTKGIGPSAFLEPRLYSPDASLLSVSADPDKDRISVSKDNCPKLKNPAQTATDQDGVGDACDLDLDDDSVLNKADNCPTVWNADQADSNNDGLGDACTPPS